MQSNSKLLGTLLILIGIITLAYQGFTYTKHEKVAQIGDVSITADTQKTVYLSPVFGGVALAIGVFLLVAGRNKDD